MEPFDIVKLIEKNPITRMNNKNYESKLVQNLKNTFSNDEQKLFLSSFYCFLNHKDNEFVVNFDNIWKWCGFARKGHAKTLLEKHFQKDIDYIISTSITNDTEMTEEKFASANAEANFSSNTQENECEIVDLELTDEYKNLIKSEKKRLIEICKNKKLKTSGTKADLVTRILNNDNNKNAGGQNKETIMLTITTFKKFCMKANTKKADEVHNYYIKLEKILHEIIIEQSDELTLQLSLKNNEIKALEKSVYAEQCLVVKQQQSLLYQQEKVTNRQKLSRTGCIYVVYDPCWKFTKYKIGSTNDFNIRLGNYRTLAPELKTCYILYTPYYELFEECIKLKFAEFVEQPSHEIYVMDLKDIINDIKNINISVGFNCFEEKELWKINNEPPPNENNIDKEFKCGVPYIMPLCMRDSSKYIDIIHKYKHDKKEITKEEIKEEEGDEDQLFVYNNDKMHISEFLPARLSAVEYKMKNRTAPDGTRYCNSFCQKLCPIENFKLRSKFLFTSCENCRIMENYAINKIQNKIYTCKEIANKPHLVFLETNQKLCPYCNEIKHISLFRENRQQCKKCKELSRTKRTENFRENMEEEINILKNNLKNLTMYEDKEKLVNKYERNKLYSICQYFEIKRRSSDKKNNMIVKLLNHLNTSTF